MAVVMLVTGSVVLAGRDKLFGEKNSQALPPTSSSKEDSWGPWAFTLVLREMTDENQKAPESLKWPHPPQKVPETQSSEEGVRGESGGKLREGDFRGHEERNSGEKMMKEGFLQVLLCDVRQNFPFCQETAAKTFLKVSGSS